MSASATRAGTPRRLPAAEAQVIALPRARATAAGDEFLQSVDERLTEVVADLAQTWSSDFGDRGDAGTDGSARAPRPLDILAGHDLPELLTALTANRGKQIRPSMCFWGWVATGGRFGEAVRGRRHVVQAGAALELLHLFALIHDDVMDESASRRGQPSVHTLATQLHRHSGARGSGRRFGESIAVLVGDLAHAEADALIAELPAPMRRVWRLMVIELVHGQSRDLIGTAAGRRDLAHARQVARTKSGSYTVLRPLELGATAAGAGRGELAALCAYGAELGEAFALRDDLLGVWGDPAVTGKPSGDDLLSGKPTVILALAHDRLTGAARTALERVGTAALSKADVHALQEALVATGVADAVEGRIADHVHAARTALEHPGLDGDGVLGLTELAHRIAWREW
jgi:geranylgeranyl diphosphate synthase, type I